MLNMNGTVVFTQADRVYRLLNKAMFPRTTKEIAATLGMPEPSVRRCLSTLRTLMVVGFERVDNGYIIR